MAETAGKTAGGGGKRAVRFATIFSGLQLSGRETASLFCRREAGRRTEAISGRQLLAVGALLPAVLTLLSLILLALPLPSPAAEKPPLFALISVNAAITPSAAEHIEKGIAAAAEAGAEGLIIRLDTPGGLDTAMRDIAKAILNAPLPVILYVSPSGARAASAGAIVVAAAHIAAMAPGTNIGAAHPVGIGIGGKLDKTMNEKVENDAAAYARGIAAQRGRNGEWLERAVRKSESITADEALKLRVIDIVAVDLDDLLRQSDGREVSVKGVVWKLNTSGAVVHEKKTDFRNRVLAAISNPNIAYVLFLIGLAGLYFEFSTPGAILPGVVGGISLILAFFAMQTLSVNFAGVALIILSIILFIAEIKVVSHGILSIGGVVSLLMGSLMLFQTSGSSLRVSLSVLIPAVAVTSLFFVVIVAMAMKAQLRPRRGGSEGLIDQQGIAASDIGLEGKVFVEGEYWDASSAAPIAKGSRIRVVGIEQLKLRVEAEAGAGTRTGTGDRDQGRDQDQDQDRDQG